MVARQHESDSHSHFVKSGQNSRNTLLPALMPRSERAVSKDLSNVSLIRRIPGQTGSSPMA